MRRDCRRTGAGRLRPPRYRQSSRAAAHPPEILLSAFAGEGLMVTVTGVAKVTNGQLPNRQILPVNASASAVVEQTLRAASEEHAELLSPR